jgi:3-phosphoshikimate 1-carboxyvinyltransferase
MPTLNVFPSYTHGQLTIPSSKSHTLRAILFAGLANGLSIVENPLLSPDSYAMLHAIELLGAKIVKSDESQFLIEGVNGHISLADDVINAGNSGIILRFVSAIAALGSSPIVITGDHSIRHQRPMYPLIDALTQLGVNVKSTKGDGFAPLIIQGPLRGGTAIVHGKDSQPVSALLIAAQFAQEPIEIQVQEGGELPWIELTLDWLNKMGLSYIRHSPFHFTVPGNSKLESFHYHVPGDLSTLSFPVAAALISDQNLIIKNVDLNDCQGDKEIIRIFQEMGGKIEVDETNNTLTVLAGSQLKGVNVDINNCIDGIVILTCLACFASTSTKITGAEVAREKECNRIEAIATELRKMGATIFTHPDGLLIEPKPLKGAKLHSHNDHRMAMSLAIAALGANGQSQIEDIDCIKKTYPNFIEDFKSLGALFEVSK